MPFIKINDINLYYESYGEGSPLLFISGFASHYQSYLPYINFFSKQNQVIVFHNRGSGKTEAPKALYTIDLLVSDTLALLNALDISCASMIGSSMGAAIIMTLAMQSPERIKKGALIAPFPKLPKTTLLHSRAIGKLMQAQVPLPLLIEVALPWLFSNAFLSHPQNLKDKISEMKGTPSPQSMDGYFGQLHALENFDISKKLPFIQTEMLLLAGEEDLASPFHLTKQIKQALPHSTLHSFPETGHMLHVEKHEQVLNLIANFL